MLKYTWKSDHLNKENKMEIKKTYRHLEPTPAIENKIDEKAAHLQKYFDSSIDVKWVCEVDGHQQKSDVSLHCGKHHYFASSEGSNLYKTFDQVVSKIESQIRKNSKNLNSKHSNGFNFEVEKEIVQPEL
jgi:putative sigma-54 modulation protein